ncbi:hypothetical protein [Telluria antibiotica]|nr:hypothetical protein [Telluria antibiotica]
MKINNGGVTTGVDPTEHRKMIMLLKSLINAAKRYVAPQNTVADE